ncbi:acyl-CoA synthetase (AMP-forming)/AMP-acid ligase II (macronuclear) [Tetrahymena thermophila SB210]|uniref:Acyl-CoA synthetase (AMP-forming)/AMP-acid ligase II n=1 Tax=Tetrahymena thermophila (strain SB210) TaxID=312017 RepID=Q24DT0_TETTS|nr:acyl-CoA synthetase (AMP-forming)/AMP-acid ligase II [Tetrahymena thermophila SB210]EAS05910.2 acyl-CoA synthetase (AMP-forming)/AMP-acid ligase II [Tetrahymena thermophila SB210]|eukprot:XP_001026155.2 acyl-CoA synthetase (AMP-forming)/AMP-acid ligase II [Tetrahymena thermophila SB210]
MINSILRQSSKNLVGPCFKQYIGQSNQQLIKKQSQPFSHSKERKGPNVSYFHGTSNSKLQYITIGDKLKETAEHLPDHQALISHHQNVVFTYSQLYQKCEQLAASLIALGLKKGDRIGIYSPNNYEWCLLQYAASMADVILVNINPAYQEHELEYCLNKVGCRALVMSSQFKKSNYIEMINNLAPELKTSQFGKLKSIRLPSLQFVIRIDDEPTPGMLNFQQLMKLGTSKDISLLHRRMKATTPDDATNIQFTSGTTGRPKGATLTHFNILNDGYFIGERLGYTKDDSICVPVPLYHCFGMVIGNLTAINYGSTIVLPSEGFSAQKAMEAVTKYKCTSIYGVPTMFLEYIKEYESNPSIYNYTSLSKGVMAGALCPESLMNKLISQWGIKNIQICYGQTETSPVFFQTSQDDSLTDKCTTVGQIFPHCEVKLINKQGKVVQIGEKGEICVRGFCNMEKYWGDIKNTNKTIDNDNWLKTGDVGQLDERGYLKIVGRIKELIIRGGENVYPKEIEEYLRTNPKILDVYVVGVPDQKFGEEIFALIRLKDGVQFDKQEIYDFCKGQIAHFKVPKYVKVVESFPLTITGKPQKFKMVESLMQELKQQKNFDQYQIRTY